jgi:hypothetical protein
MSEPMYEQQVDPEVDVILPTYDYIEKGATAADGLEKK